MDPELRPDLRLVLHLPGARLYEWHGYAECARLVDYPLDGSADVYLRKDL